MPCVVNMGFLPECCAIVKFHRLGHRVIHIFCYATFFAHSRHHFDKMTNTWSSTHHSAWQSCCLLLLFPFISLLNAFFMFPLTGDWKNRAVASWNAGILAVKWQHLVCTWVQTPTSGVWKQEIESKWAAAVCFCFCGPQVFHCTAKTWAAGQFGTVDVVNLCGEKPLHGHTIDIQKQVY